MVKVSQLVDNAHFDFLSTGDLSLEIEDVFIGDLLSWVMAKGSSNNVWITIQAHLNVIAVALLKEFSCIIICDDANVSDDVINKAREENVNLIHTSLSAYQCAKYFVSLEI